MTPQEWTVLDDLLGLLKPLREATALIEAESFPTLGLVVPLVTYIRRQVEAQAPSTPEGRVVQAQLVASLRKRYENHLIPNGESTLLARFLLAVFFDPVARHGPFTWMVPASREAARRLAEHAYSRLNASAESADRPAPSAPSLYPPPSLLLPPPSSLLITCRSTGFFAPQPGFSEEVSVEGELQRYVRTVTLDPVRIGPHYLPSL